MRDVLNVVEKSPRVLILRMRHVPVIDATGLHALGQVRKNCAAHGIELILSAVHEQPMKALRRSGQLEAIRPENVTRNIDEALRRAAQLVGQPVPPHDETTKHGQHAA